MFQRQATPNNRIIVDSNTITIQKILNWIYYLTGNNL